jgi:hypothetical protein
MSEKLFSRDLCIKGDLYFEPFIESANRSLEQYGYEKLTEEEYKEYMKWLVDGLDDDPEYFTDYKVSK